MMVPEILVAGNLAMAKLSKADQEVVMKAAEPSVDFQKASGSSRRRKMKPRPRPRAAISPTWMPRRWRDFEKAMQPIYAEYSDFSDLINQIKAVK